MKPLTHPVTLAFGLTNLFLLALTGPFISPDRDLVYHLIGASGPIVVPILAYIAALWLLLSVLLLLAEPTAEQPAEPATQTPAEIPEPPLSPEILPSHLRIFIWTALVLSVPWSLLYTAAGPLDWPIPTWVHLLIATAILLAALFLTARRRAVAPIFNRLQPPIATGLGFLSITTLLIFSQFLWAAFASRNLNPPTLLHHSNPQPVQASSTHPRILWIVLDELSYDQIYEHRFPGLSLPAFDQFATQSTSFTHVIPAGEYTRAVIPALLTGVPTNHIRVSAHGDLLALHNPVDKQWRPFDPHQTVFADALAHGYRTGVAGWYNPYCRILPTVLDRCFWTYREFTPATLSSTATTSANLFVPLHTLVQGTHYLLSLLHVATPISPPASDAQNDLHQHTADYQSLLTAGDQLLADPSTDFTFLHIPVPHPSGFYDRRRHTFASARTSYLDNLALADLYLAHVRQQLESTGQWDSTAVLIMGDHSWRTSFVWLKSSSWTSEDDQASHGGQFDDRPAYLLKLPHQHQPTRIDDPFDAVRTRALLDALLTGTLQTPADLTRWSQSTQ